MLCCILFILLACIIAFASFNSACNAPLRITLTSSGDKAAMSNNNQYDDNYMDEDEEKVDNKWQEIWTIRACSRTATVPINFELKEDGGSYAIDPMGVRVSSN